MADARPLRPRGALRARKRRCSGCGQGKQVFVEVARIRPDAIAERLQPTGQLRRGGRLLERLAPRKRHVMHQAVRPNVGHHVVDGEHGAAVPRLAVLVVTPRTTVRASLHEHGIAQPRPIHDGIRSRAIQADGFRSGHGSLACARKGAIASQVGVVSQRGRPWCPRFVGWCERRVLRTQVRSIARRSSATAARSVRWPGNPGGR